ncbi:hypothetical protein HYFRA_00012598 [Hymenoscyphus fraxineus]|uniref:Uncharacterized protein n=1 Tax=Hymenoscyphus fraxineus TaxID=746836 RepID=A0A9N9PXE5_9HELO|nr:hypothetical protein HYFRA_00012598 [Hymenoscyphus fraxineus]
MDHGWIHPAVLARPRRAEYGVGNHKGNAKGYHRDHAGPCHDPDLPNNGKEAQIKAEKCHSDHRATNSNEDRVG